MINSSRERVVACTQLSAKLWRDIISPEIAWESLHYDAAVIAAQRPGWTLAHEPDISREVQYMRFVKGEGGLIETGCAEGDADFVTLRLVVWAEPPEGAQDGGVRNARRQ